MNIKEALNVIKSAYPITADNEITRTFSHMAEIVKEKTNNFENPELISDQKIDVSSMLSQENVELSDWLKSKDKERSEKDTVIFFAKEIQDYYKKGTKPSNNLALVKAKAKALKLKLQLLKL